MIGQVAFMNGQQTVFLGWALGVGDKPAWMGGFAGVHILLQFSSQTSGYQLWLAHQKAISLGNVEVCAIAGLSNSNLSKVLFQPLKFSTQLEAISVFLKYPTDRANPPNGGSDMGGQSCVGCPNFTPVKAINSHALKHSLLSLLWCREEWFVLQLVFFCNEGVIFR